MEEEEISGARAKYRISSHKYTHRAANKGYDATVKGCESCDRPTGAGWLTQTAGGGCFACVVVSSHRRAWFTHAPLSGGLGPAVLRCALRKAERIERQSSLHLCPMLTPNGSWQYWSDNLAAKQVCACYSLCLSVCLFVCRPPEWVLSRVPWKQSVD